MFRGRDKELAELNRLYAQESFQLFILYGRRRVGKTTLLKEFCKGKPHIFYSAEQSNNKMNLDKFSAQIFQYYGENNLESFSSWENAISYIDRRQRTEPLVLVFDEFPYIANINPALLSILQHLIDHQLRERKIFLILCGSYMGFMEKEVLSSKSPLFGRRTAQLHMKPFDYRMSLEFLQNFSMEEKLILYSVFGGTAMYLQRIDNSLTLRENIQNLYLKPTGYLYEEPLLLMRQEVQEPGVYCAIIEAIAKGAVKSNEIAAKTGEDAAKCLKYIAIMRELGILYREIPLGEKENARKTQYGICDSMFRFWYRYVAPNRTLLETDAYDIVWKRKIEPDLSHYMGHAFENICKEYLLYQNSLGNLPILFTEIGRWWGTDSKEHKEVEINLAAKDGNDYLIGECKWRSEPTDYSVYMELMKKGDVFCRKRKCDNLWYLLFSKNGFTETLQKEARENRHLILITIDDFQKDLI
ncbi:MAG: ATP-binding protein [Lachnospiraceae bacterium]|nr:ATP-binding protein [Lachnospiraceae bacterium]